MNTQLREDPHGLSTPSDTHADAYQLTVVERIDDDIDADDVAPGLEHTDESSIAAVPDRLVPVVDAISTVTHSDIDVLLAALQRRNNELRAARAQRAVIGKHVIVSDIVPRYLDGLAGDIEEIDGQWVAVRLTEESTGRLRFCGQDDYQVGSGRRFLLTGVPAVLCFDPAELPDTA